MPDRDATMQSDPAAILALAHRSLALAQRPGLSEARAAGNVAWRPAQPALAGAASATALRPTVSSEAEGPAH